jgi:predicted HTH domain antitoxin
MSDSGATETDERLAAAVGGYALGELTLGQAAERADRSRFAVADRLRASSVDRRLGPAGVAAARRELDVARSVR